MIKSYQVLTDYPRVRLSPVNLSEFARLIEDAYADDLWHERLDWRAREDVVSRVINRFRSCDGWPGIKAPLALWEHRRNRLEVECG
jgi:hypothetical protein